MRQYTYQITEKVTGATDSVKATAASPTIARAQIILMYGLRWNVAEQYSVINTAHRFFAEIDCSRFPEKDTAWLMRVAGMEQGVSE